MSSLNVPKPKLSKPKCLQQQSSLCNIKNKVYCIAYTVISTIAILFIIIYFDVASLPQQAQPSNANIIIQQNNKTQITYKNNTNSVDLTDNYSKEEEPSDTLAEKWQLYNLGDTVKFREDNSKPSNRRARERNVKKTPHSIAADYIRRTNKSFNYDALMDILNERMQNNEPFQIPNDNELVVHLRTGDVIDHSNNSVTEMLSKYTKYVNGKSYVKPMSYYKQVMRFAARKNLTRVTLVTGFHQTEKVQTSVQKSLNYLNRVRGAFEGNDFQTYIRLNGNPDEDFIFMCNSRYFVQSGGGFSKIIAELIKMKNGTVF